MNNKTSESGFSLVEMMVVVVIIGLMTSAVVLTLPSKNTELLQTAERTEKAMTLLSRRSVMTGEILGARFMANGFEVLKLSDNGWAVEGTILKPESQVWITARPVKLDVNNADIDFSGETVNPHIWFLPTGEHPSFKLILASSGQRAEIFAVSSGIIKVAHDG